MSAESVMSASTIEILDQPFMRIDGIAAVKVVALERFSDTNQPSRIAGHVSTAPYTAPLIAEFSGMPTGEYVSGTAVSGMVGSGEVYYKQIANDLPFWGLRTVLAKRKAERIVRSHLKV